MFTYPHREVSQQANIAALTAAFAQLDCFQFRNAKAICRTASRGAFGFEKMQPILKKLRWVDCQLSREVLRLFEDTNYHADANKLLAQICEESVVDPGPPTILFGTPLPPEPKILRFDDDMPEAVLTGRLGELCRERMLRDFPIAYAWTSLLAAAGVMVPVVEPTPGFIGTPSPTNLYSALVGPVHSGKSQAIKWARLTLGLPREYYSREKSASAEGLMKSLMTKKKKGTLLKSLLVDLDEWEHLFKKANIDCATFLTFLQTAFYESEVQATLGGGFHVDLECALTFLGGIVRESFSDLFSARTMSGAYDRFLFGLCPEKFNFMYRDYEGERVELNPIPVTIAKDVHEMIKEMRKGNKAIGREAELALRAAHICASFDGRPILKAVDCERSVVALINDQLRVRSILKPSIGLTKDADMANDLMEWAKVHARDGRVVPERELLQAMRRRLEKLGPGIFKATIQNLIQMGLVAVGEDPDGRVWNGHRPRLYQFKIEED